MPSRNRFSESHIASLDGFRGVAILLVLVFHFFMDWPFWTGHIGKAMGHLLTTGWVGVPLFFVLSGFLITGILLDTRPDPHRWRNFFVRRTLRIFPLFYLALVLSFLVVPLLAQRFATVQPLVMPAWTAPYFFTYTSNYLLAPKLAVYPMHLAVSWSLAVEEQFYLLWPLILWWVPKNRARELMIGAILLAQFCKILMLIFVPDTFAEYWTPCSLDGFGFGGLMAVLIREPGLTATTWGKFRRWGLYFASPVAAALVIAARGLPYAVRLIVLRGFVFWAAAACLLALVTNSNPRLGRFFSHPWLRRFGKYSYCMYLFHGVLVPYLGAQTVDAQATGPDLLFQLGWRLVMYFLIVYVVGAISFAWFERPIQNLKRFFQSSGTPG